MYHRGGDGYGALSRMYLALGGRSVVTCVGGTDVEAVFIVHLLFRIELQTRARLIVLPPPHTLIHARQLASR